jgi:hypothetical protein
MLKRKSQCGPGEQAEQNTKKEFPKDLQISGMASSCDLSNLAKPNHTPTPHHFVNVGAGIRGRLVSRSLVSVYSNHEQGEMSWHESTKEAGIFQLSAFLIEAY